MKAGTGCAVVIRTVAVCGGSVPQPTRIGVSGSGRVLGALVGEKTDVLEGPQQVVEAHGLLVRLGMDVDALAVGVGLAGEAADEPLTVQARALRQHVEINPRLHRP